MPTMIRVRRRDVALAPAEEAAMRVASRRNALPIVPCKRDNMSHHNLYILETPDMPTGTLEERTEALRRAFRLRLQFLRHDVEPEVRADEQ